MHALIEHLLAAYNAPFGVALCTFLLLGALQVAAFFLGSEWFSFMDDWVPELGAPGAEGGAPTVIEGALSVLYVGRVPFAITFLLWLFVFSAVGYNLQLASLSLGFGALGAGWAALVSFLLALPIVALGNRVLARVLPGDETRAVSEDALVGLSGEVTLGTVTSARPSEGKFRDHYRNTHYLQVVAENAGESFAAGDQVLIVGRSGHLYTVVLDPLSEKKG